MNSNSPQQSEIIVKRRYLVLFVLLVAFVMYGVGIFAPLMTVKKGIFFIYVSGQPVSIIFGLWQFLLEGEYILFLLIAVFTIVFPVFKFYILFTLCRRKHRNSEKYRQLISKLSHISKWSMLDVFVVAVIIVAVKIKSIAKVEVHYGLYIFSISILITMALTYLISKPKKTAENSVDS